MNADNECPLRSSNPPAWPGTEIFPIVAIRPIPYSFVYYYNDKGVREHMDLLSIKQVEAEAEKQGNGKDNIYDKYIDNIRDLIREVCNKVVDCNFNTILLTGSFERFDEVLAILNEREESDPEKRKNELFVILESGWLFNSPSCAISALKRYINEDLVNAWQVKDEPKPQSWGDIMNFNDVCAEYNQLTLAYGMTSSIDRNRLSLFNLAASVKEGWIGRFSQGPSSEATKYMNYLENLHRLYKPFIWSYDMYPIMYNINKDTSEVTDELTVDYDNFYKYLNLFSTISRTYNSKFWAYAMCMEHYDLGTGNKTTQSRPAPTIGQLRFEIFNALAFGAQGIVYYQFGLGDPKIYIDQRSGQVDVAAPLEFEFNFQVTENPISGKYEPTNPETQDGYPKYYIKGLKEADPNKDIYKIVQQANEELNLWVPIFLGCEVVGYRHRRHSSVYPHIDESEIPLLAPNEDFGCIKNIELPEGNVHGVFVSMFKNKSPKKNSQSRNYIAIVNEDPLGPISIRVYVDGLATPGYYTIDKLKNQGEITQSDSNDFVTTANNEVPEMYKDFDLQAGEMVVIFWDKKMNYPDP